MLRLLAALSYRSSEPFGHRKISTCEAWYDAKRVILVKSGCRNWEEAGLQEKRIGLPHQLLASKIDDNSSP